MAGLRRAYIVRAFASLAGTWVAVLMHGKHLQLSSQLPTQRYFRKRFHPEPTDLQTVPQRDASWTTAGGSRHFCTSVARLNDRVRMDPIVGIPLGEAAEGQFAVSRLGTLAGADITLDGEEPVTVVSLYAPWERPRDGGWIVADASAHRLVSDVCLFIESQSGHRVIAAGDLNILFGYGDDGSPYWRERYGCVFSRMAAIGLSLVGPQYPNGNQADPWPAELPVGSPSKSTPRVVTFSPICPAETVNPASRSSSCNSTWIRYTWRRLGSLGSRATRERCLIVSPKCASPSTPSPARSRMVSLFGLIRVCVALRLTAVTTSSI